MRTLSYRVSASAVSAACAVGALACGGSSNAVVVRAGNSEITKATVDHWMSILSSGQVKPSASPQGQTVGREALDFLISSAWLLGQASEDGWRITASEVEQQLAKDRRSNFPGGEAESREFATSTGRSAGDMRYEAKAQLASAEIRQSVLDRAVRITEAQVAAYYAAHRSSFASPEQREIYVTNRKHDAEAQAVVHRVMLTNTFPRGTKHELITRQTVVSAGRGQNALERAIFSARQGAVTGPVKGRIDFYILEVRRIFPMRIPPFALVRGAIVKLLNDAAQHDALATFIAEWRRKWSTRTDCSAGYVVQKCRQYSGTPASEEPLTLN